MTAGRRAPFGFAGIHPDRAGELRHHCASDRGQERERGRAKIARGERQCEQAGQRQDLPMAGVSIHGFEKPDCLRPHSHRVNQHSKCGRNWAVG